MIVLELVRMADIPRAAARRLGTVTGPTVELTIEAYREVLAAKTLRLPLAEILAAAPTKRPGYIEACMAAGQVVGDWIEFTAEEAGRLREAFGGAGSDAPSAGCPGCGG